jgi:cytidine deaminase
MDVAGIFYFLERLYMDYLRNTEAEQLYARAVAASENTYSPYSNYPVGAAVLTVDGDVVPGTNVENASYSLTICAERIALGYAISSGKTDIKAIAVYSKKGDAAPCGACRQFIIEFGKDIIIIFKNKGEIVQRTIAELLPFEFSKATMSQFDELADQEHKL